MQRSPQNVRCPSSTYKSIQVWHHSDHNIGTRLLKAWATHQRWVMEFKPAKSRALVVSKGKVPDKICFTVGGILIPAVTEKPVKKCLKKFWSNQQWSRNLVYSDVQVWAARKVQSMDLPAWHPATTPLASVGLRGSANYSRGAWEDTSLGHWGCLEASAS